MTETARFWRVVLLYNTLMEGFEYPYYFPGGVTVEKGQVWIWREGSSHELRWLVTSDPDETDSVSLTRLPERDEYTEKDVMDFLNSKWRLDPTCQNCPKCAERPTLADDYLCARCRYG